MFGQTRFNSESVVSYKLLGCANNKVNDMKLIKSLLSMFSLLSTGCFLPVIMPHAKNILTIDGLVELDDEPIRLGFDSAYLVHWDDNPSELQKIEIKGTLGHRSTPYVHWIPIGAIVDYMTLPERDLVISFHPDQIPVDNMPRQASVDFTLRYRAPNHEQIAESRYSAHHPVTVFWDNREFSIGFKDVSLPMVNGSQRSIRIKGMVYGEARPDLFNRLRRLNVGKQDSDPHLKSQISNSKISNLKFEINNPLGLTSQTNNAPRSTRARRGRPKVPSTP